MKKNNSLYLLGILLIVLVSFLFLSINNDKTNTYNIDIDPPQTLEATVLTTSDNTLTVQSEKSLIYTFNIDNVETTPGTNLLIEYTGTLDHNKLIQTSTITDYSIYPVSKNEDGINTDWLDEGIFSKYYILANNKLKTLSLDEKIGQLILARYPDTNAKEDLKTYHLGGYIFFEKDFRNKTEDEVKKEISELQATASIPILTAVDEEGGKVTRISTNSNLVPEKFKSPQELYQLGGFNQIKEDTINKSKILKNLGLNLNLAPVVDVSTNSQDYMYERTLGQNTELTSEYAKAVISASLGTGVSYTLKHFPGYGNNEDTHTSSSTDTRTLEEIMTNDIPPFQSGIEAGAEAVLVSHNIVNSIDADNPASLSPTIHNILRDDLNFTGVIITDDLAMGAISGIDTPAVKALLAGNDIIITTNYQKSINDIKTAIDNNTISEELIDKLAFKVLAWKYYKGLLFESQK